MRAYAITSVGRAFATSVRAPDTPDWRVIHYLDKKNSATVDEISRYCALSDGEASNVLHRLQAKKIVIAC